MNKKNMFLAALVMVLVLTGLRISGSDVSASPESELESLDTDNPISQDRPSRIAHSSRHDPEAKMARLTSYESITQAYLQGEISAEERLFYLAKISQPDADENEPPAESNDSHEQVVTNNAPDNDRHNQPGRPVGDSILFLPLVLKSPVSGRVTENSAPAAMQEVLLRYYDGLTWYTFDTAVTDENGNYMFSSAPTLEDDQMYYVRWDNLDDNDARLFAWYCNEVTTSSPVSANTCNFDIENIVLNSPAHGATVNLPQAFTWTPRGFSSDSYEILLFDFYEDIFFETFPSLGNVNSYTLNNRPAGFSSGIAYGWYVGVATIYGWGDSYYSQEVTFTGSAPGPRITGRVTFNGSSASGVSLKLRYYNGSSWSDYGAPTSTSSSGYYSFNNLPVLSVDQGVYVRWDNSADNTNRLWTWHCYTISVVSFSREYTCNFDLKNIPLVSPAHLATVSLPINFTWTPRGFSGDSYVFNLFDPNDPNLDFFTPLIGNTNSYMLSSLPIGFTPFIQYGWDVWTYTDYDGYGISNYSYRITFTNSGSGVTPAIQLFPRQRGWLLEDPLGNPQAQP